MQAYCLRNHNARIVAILLLGCLTASLPGRLVAATQPAAKVVLNQATIVVDPEEPSFVQFAVKELAGYLAESTGGDITIAASPDNAQQTQILVGAKTAQRVFSNAIPDAKLGEEGYRVKCEAKGGVNYVVATGSGPRGTKAAVAVLMKSTRVEGKTASISLDVAGKPAFALRGMHLNGWPLAYPHSFRNWREADWQRYLDTLSLQGVNLFYLWPFIEIMPVPLSAEDQAYLEECRRVVDYAQKKHGMEVWIMQCANRVAQDRCGVADPRVRPYWRPSQEDLDPGKPENLKAILESREAMYRIVNNADGVCNIDSDPGFYAGSPIGDYVKVLQGCRALIDRHMIRGKETKLINWILWGWGRVPRMQLEGLAEHQRLALRALKKGLPEPFWLISGQFPEYLPMCRDEGVLGQTIYLPYGAIEGEPAYPQTQLNIDSIRATFDGPDAKMPGLAGVMGNVQSPPLQFPDVFFFTSVMADLDYRKRSERGVLLDLSGYLYPDHAQLLADCYQGLKEPDPAKVEALDARLNDILEKNALGRPGLFGRKLFPDHRVIATSLHQQLRLRAARQRLMQGIAATTSKDECARLLCDYFDAYIAWDHAQGWHALWGWDTWPLPDLPVSDLAANLRRALANDADVNACFDEIARRLSSKHDAAIVHKGCVAPLKSAVLALPVERR
jgi:hypothetical protein